MKPVLNLVCYVSLCEGLRAGAGSLSYIVHVDCCGLSTIVIKEDYYYYYILPVYTDGIKTSGLHKTTNHISCIILGQLNC